MPGACAPAFVILYRAPSLTNSAVIVALVPACHFPRIRFWGPEPPQRRQAQGHTNGRATTRSARFHVDFHRLSAPLYGGDGNTPMKPRGPDDEQCRTGARTAVEQGWFCSGCATAIAAADDSSPAVIILLVDGMRGANFQPDGDNRPGQYGTSFKIMACYAQAIAPSAWTGSCLPVGTRRAAADSQCHLRPATWARKKLR